MKIAIIGSGYVGTVTGTCFAELGHDVLCADINEARIESLQQGTVPFYEQGLEALIRTNMDQGRLSFTTNIQAAVRDSEIVYLCIGTPPLPNGKPDLRSLEKAVREISTAMNGYKLIVEKSTLPIKTGEWLIEMLNQHLPKGASFDLAAVPQFLREGSAIRDFMKPERIVIGAEKQEVTDTLVRLYTPLNAPILVTDINSAELIKHATNTFLAMKISFINSIAQICEKTGADVTQVAQGLGMDSRVTHSYLNAGIGYGGIFFPKDIAALVNIASEYHINLDLVKSVEVINRYQRLNFVERVERTLGGHHLDGKTIAVWGLAYRPHTDDMRDTPSLSIIPSLINRGAKIRAYDPLAMEKAKEKLRDITYCQDVYDSVKGADAIVILTEWEEFTHVDFRRLKEESQCRVIIDGRNLFKPERMRDLGYTYVSVGRKTLLPEGETMPPASKGKKQKLEPVG